MQTGKLLILVRHGKAQSRDLGLVDFERELTGAGKRSLKAWLTKSGQLLAEEGVGSFELWASPAARTMQTGNAVVKTWGKVIKAFPREPQPIQALWDGSTEEVLDLVEQSTADAIVICGHNPDIEHLCALLSGSSLRFATGGVAALRLDGGIQPGTARLLWFIQGPESRNWKKRLS